jgi:hypothetical protein
MFDTFERTKANQAPERKFFRLYWSGDIANKTTACALYEAIYQHPSIQFWVYTRTFDVVPYLVDIPNLKLFVSIDKINFRGGTQEFSEWSRQGKLKFAYMGLRNPSDEYPYVDFGGKFVTCPVDAGTSKLASACLHCKICLSGKHNVWFKTK